MKNRPKIIVIVGQTATGKSDLAVQIAKKINGEVISADSRQVYRGLNIGSGKITKKEMAGVPHHLLDVANPKRIFSVFEYKQKAEKVLERIWAKGKTPILVGGTGQYIEAVIDNVTFPEVPPNKKLRLKLENISISKLQNKLKKLDPRRFKEIDQNNPVRLIRAIEIAIHLGKVPKVKKSKRDFDLLILGLKTDKETLHKRIHLRLLGRIRKGMVAEVRKLHRQGLSWKRMESLGLEYRYLGWYLQGKLNKQEMLGQLEKEIVKYAKRQHTWFKRNKVIKWFDLKNQESCLKLVQDFVID